MKTQRRKFAVTGIHTLKAMSPPIQDAPFSNHATQRSGCFPQAEEFKGSNSVGRQEQACADFPQLRCTLANNRVKAPLLEGEGGRESADACSCDHNPAVFR